MVCPLPSLPIRARQQLLGSALAFVIAFAGLTNGSAAEYLRSVLADGFDYPVGKPDAYGYYKARGYRPNGHQGEDWNGRGGGNTDLGDPVYATAHGVVVYSADYGVGWGNVIILRHAYRHTKDGNIYYVDALYGHLHERAAKLHDKVRRGQKIGSIGTNKGMYWAHLHFEMRKNLSIGMNRSAYGQDYSNYFDPSDFIDDRRSLRKEYRVQQIPVDTFGSGISNLFRGKSIAIPPMPEGAPDPSKVLDAELRRILEKNDLDRESRDQTTDQTSRSTPTEPPVDTPEMKKDRDDIKSFWSKFRDKLGEGTIDPGTPGKVDPPQ